MPSRATSSPWDTPRMSHRTAPIAPPRKGQPDPTLSMAVLLLLGVGISSHPTRLPAALTDYFGEERAPALEGRVLALLAETESCIPSGERGTLSVAQEAERVAATMRARHRELSADALQALNWSFTFNNR